MFCLCFLHDFAPIFTSYSITQQFFGGGAKKIFAPGRRVPSLRHWQMELTINSIC